LLETDEIERQQQTTGGATTLNGHVAEWLRFTHDFVAHDFGKEIA